MSKKSKITKSVLGSLFIILMGGSCGKLSIAGLRSKIFAQEVPEVK
jgi:hypothetical protein